MDKPKKIVPFHRAKIDRIPVATLTEVVAFECNDRRVEVWKIQGTKDVCVRIFRDTTDGKRSKLAFGMTSEAAERLSIALAMQTLK